VVSPSGDLRPNRSQYRHARVLHQNLFALLVLAVLQHRTLGDHRLGDVVGALAHLGKLGLQRLVLWLRRVEAVERGAGVLRLGDAGQHVGRIGLGEIVDDVGGDTAVMHAAGHGVAGEGEHRVGEFDLGFGQRVGLHAGLDLRDRIFARIEAVGIDAGEIGRRGLGAVGDCAIGDPERREVTACVERLDGDALLLAAEDAVEFSGRQLLAKLVDNRCIGRDRCGVELDAIGRGCRR